MPTLYLAAAQIHKLPANHVVPLDRIGLLAYFFTHYGYKHEFWRFPHLLCIAPVPTEMGAKFCADLGNAGVDLEKLPKYPQDMEVLDLKYPLPFSVEWLELRKITTKKGFTE